MGGSRRATAESGLYHVVTRGNGRQILFEDDRDRRFFLETLGGELPKRSVGIIAWCLMENHVHLVLEDCSDGIESLSEAMRVLLATYARRFNGRGGHVGHVFQARFSSTPIEDERHLLATVRYVHLNPERAGICPAEKYEWSSYAEYVGCPGICSTGLVLDLVGGREGFVEFCRESCSSDLPVDYRPPRASADELLMFARGVLADAGFGSPESVKSLPKGKRDAALRVMSAAGMSIREIERMTGVGRGTVYGVVRS